jgi:hypothetical protein
MLSTVQRATSAIRSLVQRSYHSRLFSLCQAPQNWYRKLDADARKAVIERAARAYNVRLADPVIREAVLGRQRLEYQKDGHIRRRKTFLRWCSRKPWLREQLPWKTHRPMYYDQRVEHDCVGCHWPKSSGSRLWYVHARSPFYHQKVMRPRVNIIVLSVYFMSDPFRRASRLSE